MGAADLLWVIVALPFAGAAANGFLATNRRKALVTAIGVAAPGLALVAALVTLWRFLGDSRIPSSYAAFVQEQRRLGRVHKDERQFWRS